MPFYNPLLEQFATPIYYFTATILGWKKLLASDQNKLTIIKSLKFIVAQKRITLYAFVIMPNHIHLIFSLYDEYPLSSFKRDFLKYTAQVMKLDLLKNNPGAIEEYKSTQNDRHYQFWERRPLAIPVYNEKTFFQKLNYIHNNPVSDRWKLAPIPEDYYYSSAKFYNTDIDDWGFIKHYRED